MERELQIDRVELLANNFITNRMKIILRDPFEAHCAVLAESSSRRAKYLMTGANNEDLLLSALSLERVAEIIEERYF